MLGPWKCLQGSKHDRRRDLRPSGVKTWRGNRFSWVSVCTHWQNRFLFYSNSLLQDKRALLTVSSCFFIPCQLSLATQFHFAEESTSPQHFNAFLERKSYVLRRSPHLRNIHQQYRHRVYLLLFFFVYVPILRATKNIRVLYWNAGRSINWALCFFTWHGRAKMRCHFSWSGKNDQLQNVAYFKEWLHGEYNWILHSSTNIW